MSYFNNLGLLYHGTSHRFTTFDIRLCNKTADFGQGFYLTPDKQMAYKMAHRVARISRLNEAFIYTYIIDKSKLNKSFRKIEFAHANIEWLEFVVMNRTNISNYNPYDIIIGPTADSKVSNIIRDYIRYEYGDPNLYSTKIAVIEMLKANVFSTQICLHTQRAVNCAKLVSIVRV